MTHGIAPAPAVAPAVFVGCGSEDRMRRLYMTQPYYAVPNGYFVAKRSGYRHAGDLDGKTIGSCADCSHQQYLTGEAIGQEVR
jgi:hypothetical protein